MVFAPEIARMKIIAPMIADILVPPAPGKLITELPATSKVRKRDF
jgi:hypothetical protein